MVDIVIIGLDDWIIISGLDIIENLESHDNEQIYRMAYDIISDYFSQDDGEHTRDIWVGDGGSMQMDTPDGGFDFS